MQEQLEAAQAERDAVKAEHADRERVAQATADEVAKVKEALERERAEKKALEQYVALFPYSPGLLHGAEARSETLAGAGVRHAL